MLRYFSLFTGIGGLDMGLKEIGADCVGYSEIKAKSIEVYRRHNPTHINFGDITEIDFNKLPDFDVLTGGFPCQAFSIAGIREGFKDRRGQMIFYIYDLIKIKQPKWLVLENVKGLLIHNHGKTYIDIIKLLMSAGYFVRVLLLNACHYGSAQSRERLIFLCQLNKDFPIKRPVVIDDKKRFRDIRDFNEKNFYYVEETSKNIKKIEQTDPYSFFLTGGYDRIPTITTAVSGGGGRNPSSQQKIVQEENGFRYLTELEAERLQGFADGYTDNVSRTARWFALGNAVNCDMSRYIFKDYLKGLWW